MAEVNIPVQAQGEDPNHNAAMLAKAEAGVNTNGAAAATDAKPEWLGEFESPEEMRKAYDAMRTKMSAEGAPKQGAEAGTQQNAEEGTQNAAEATREQAAEAAQNAGVDMAALEAEFMENEGLTDATYAKLAEAGFDRSQVDAYIAGQQALGEQMQSRMEQHVGGADRLQGALEWAASNLSPTEAEAFNATVDSANEEGLKLALSGLMAKYDEAGGNEPSLLGGATNGNAGSAFRSVAEVTKAMRDPRYANDPAYRADVEAMLARSTVF